MVSHASQRLGADSPEAVTPERITSAFKHIIDDFIQYLTTQKENGNTAFSISGDSKKAMDAWGSAPQASDPFRSQGSPSAKIFIIDSQGHQGEFFTSKGGQLLKKILSAIHLTPEQVFICNAANLEHIRKAVKTGAPAVIITLGQDAAHLLLNTDKPLKELCGRFHDFSGCKVMPTFHPALLLKKPEFKRQVWEDMKQVMACAGLKNGS